MSQETWKPIPGYGGHYEASDRGRVRVMDRVIVRRQTNGQDVEHHYKGKVLAPTRSGRGHLQVKIGQGGKEYTVRVHRLVLFAFVGPCPEGMECCHYNGIHADNRLENLRWDTRAANSADRVRHGAAPTGERHGRAYLTAETVRSIRGESGLSARAIGKKYGIDSKHAYDILRRKIWRSVS